MVLGGVTIVRARSSVLGAAATASCRPAQP
jgi:hypothetical protein